MFINESSNEIDVKRIGLLAVVAVVLLIVLIGRSAYLQLIEGGYYRNAAESNSEQNRILRPVRGVILDCRGKALATNRASFDLIFTSRGVPREEYEAIAERLSKLTGASAGELFLKMLDSRKRPFTPVILISDISRNILAAVEENLINLNGVGIDNRTIRYYPFGPATAHLMGYIGEVTQEEVDNSDTLIAGDWIGRAGLELSLEGLLAGVKGGENAEVDALGQTTRVLSKFEPRAGDKVVLTIDADLQVWAHEAFKGQKGALVAVDPQTGKVLALYSSPVYDPNAFVDKERIQERMSYFVDTDLPLFNRALMATYSPGSTFKTITMIAGLKTGLLKPSTRFNCSGSYKGMKCWKKGGHGTLDLASAYQHSCNVYFYQAGERVWIEPMHFVAQAFGLDQYPGFGIGPEAHGVVPTPEWEHAHVKGPDGEHWGTGDVRNTAIGQGYVQVSPAQMAQVAAGASSGGIGMFPGVINKIESPNNEIIFRFKERVRENLKLDSRTIEFIRGAMRRVIEVGTGRRGRVKGLDVGGKTGTAQNPQNMDDAWFICAAPLSNPRIAISVIVDHAGQHGGTVAAPIAQYVLQRYAEREGWINAAQKEIGDVGK